MSVTVTLQLNAINFAGDWATRPAGAARSGTGKLGATTRRLRSARADMNVVHLSELRGAIESLRRGAHSPTMADSRTEAADIAFGTPSMYCGMRFAISLG